MIALQILSTVVEALLLQDLHACCFTFITVAFLNHRLLQYVLTLYIYIFWHIEIFFVMTLTCWRFVLMNQYSC